MYIPKEKRQYSYYVLPIVIGDTFIGRLEFNCNDNIITIKNLWLEKNISKKDIQPYIDAACERLMQYYSK